MHTGTKIDTYIHQWTEMQEKASYTELLIEKKTQFVNVRVHQFCPLPSYKVPSCSLMQNHSILTWAMQVSSSNCRNAIQSVASEGLVQFVDMIPQTEVNGPCMGRSPETISNR